MKNTKDDETIKTETMQKITQIIKPSKPKTIKHKTYNETIKNTNNEQMKQIIKKQKKQTI